MEKDKSHQSKKPKYLLDEDCHWVEGADEDVISLLSSSCIEESSSPQHINIANAKYYPLLFLAILMITNIYPLVTNCSIGTHDMKCLRLTSENLSPLQLTIYKV